MAKCVESIVVIFKIEFPTMRRSHVIMAQSVQRVHTDGGQRDDGKYGEHHPRPGQAVRQLL